MHEHNCKYKDRLKREYPFSDLILHIITNIYCICRDFLFQITTPKIIATNPRCMVKPCVVSNLSEPIITFNLLSGDKIVCKGKNLTSLNILELYNKHITPLAPRESEAEVEETQLKRKKKKAFRIKPGSKRRGLFL